MQSFPLWEEEDGEEQQPAHTESRWKRGREKVAPNEREKEGKKINLENELGHLTWVKQVLIQLNKKQIQYLEGQCRIHSHTSSHTLLALLRAAHKLYPVHKPLPYAFLSLD